MTTDFTRCFQVMECSERTLLDEWMNRWADLARFDVVEVVSSADAACSVLQHSPST